ncbi:unnamed protein product, partial [Larinioides sclopetarius]
MKVSLEFACRSDLPHSSCTSKFHQYVARMSTIIQCSIQQPILLLSQRDRLALTSAINIVG